MGIFRCHVSFQGCKVIFVFGFYPMNGSSPYKPPPFWGILLSCFFPATLTKQIEGIEEDRRYLGG